MRPRTKSVVCVREYFRQDGSGAPENEDDSASEEDNWMAIAMRGAPSAASTARKARRHAKVMAVPTTKYGAVPAVVKPGCSKRVRTSTLDSWEGTDIEDELETDDESDDDEDVDGIPRIRTCSHERRISFDDDVNVVEIPARSSFDAEYKKRVWYTSEELRRLAY
jgi:hypothetical protein